jgi:sugar lactone lactonase YvrE
MKARIYTFVLLCAGLAIFTSSSAFAQGPTLYVTSPDGTQILTVDGTTGATAVLFSPGAGFLPHAIVFGPDGKLYVSEPQNNQIDRVNPDGTGFEVVYKFSVSGQPTGPEGLHFNGGYDLYFTAQGPNGTSVWKIAGVATLGTGGPFPSPASVVALAAGSTSGTGAAFGRTGTLLFVDQTRSTVMQSLPPYTSATALISSGLNNPTGIAVNSTGDIFVADTGTNQILRFTETGTLVGTYVSFGASGSPLYIAFDASDKLYVVTNTETDALGDDANIFRVDPGSPSSPVLLQSLNSLCSSENGNGRGSCISGSGLLSDTGLGIAVPPTSTSLSFPYGPATSSNIFNFGSDSIKFNFTGAVLTNFTMWVTKTQVLPKNLQSQLGTAVFPVGTSCVQFSHEGGFCDTYTVAEGAIGSPAPVSGTDFMGPIQVVMAYFTQNQAQNPSLGHASGSSATFTENIIFNYVPQLIPGSDDGLSGNANGFSRFTPLNTPLVLTGGNAGSLCGLFSPAPPQGFVFSIGTTVPIKFSLTTGANCTGQFIQNAVARLSLVKVVGSNFIVQDVQSSSSSNTLNFFRIGGHQYVYNLDTSKLTPGSYVMTIWGSAFSPISVPFRLQ